MKYKIVIADDEQIIRNGIAQSINWSEFDADVVGLAADGAELEDIIRKENPDIAIVDIRMPEKSGLEVIRDTYDENMTLQYIVLSGYGNYEYTSEAMKYGVREYVLKPTDKNDIVTALKRCILRINESKRKKEIDSLLKCRIDAMIPLVKKQFLRDMIMNVKYSKKDFEDYKTMLSLDDSKYHLIYLSGEKRIADYMRLVEYAEMFFENNKLLCSMVIYDHALLAIKACENVIHLVESFKEKYESDYGSVIMCILSKEHEIYDFGKAFFEICEYEANMLMYEDNDIIFASNLETKSSFRDIETEIFKRVSDAVKQCNIGLLNDAVEKLRNEITKKRLPQPEIIIAATYMVIFVINDCNIQSGDLSVISQISTEKSLSGIIDYILKYFSGIIEAFSMHTSNNEETLVNKIKDIIEHEYKNSELTVKLLSKNKIFFSTDYISKVFKNMTGIGINKYINELRINKAKEYINKNHNAKMYLIAEECGFRDNPQYFSYVFKKFTGMSPTEYQKGISNTHLQ